ncbi:MAG TPA: ribosome maturation factor RimM [Bacillota bacterium]|nr:ribosome maturation factor RimM [Bacillota bacterium]HPP85380.1 ribosome maturation factor RimM [Bacillota bacterium]
MTSPRGIKGEVRFDCWCDSPEFLIGVSRFYLDDKGERFLTVKQYRPTIPSILFEGYEDRTAAGALAGKIIYFDRNDVTLEEGVCFNDDLLSLPVFDVDSGEQIGVLERIDEGVMNDFYFVRGEKNSYYIPVRDEFVKEISLEAGIKVKLIEGLEL